MARATVFKRFTLLLLGTLVASRCFAGQLIGTDQPTAFFATIASNLLSAELGVSLSRIQVFPTNQYTPRVHQLLQLTANLYECTTNQSATDYPFLPRVYQPLFTNDSGSIFIRGYTEVIGTNLLYKPLRDLSIEADRRAISGTDRVLGVPLIIGVRKGFPNFNQLAGDTLIRIGRALEFRRASEISPVRETNVMYLLTVSNKFGIECWNSYAAAFPRDLALSATLHVTFRLTNDMGNELIAETNQFAAAVPIPASSWSGYSPSGSSQSFRLPILTSWCTLPWSDYSQIQNRFIPLTNAFERLGSFPVPQWYAQLRVSLEYVMIDISAGAIVDYVTLDSATDCYPLTEMLMRELTMDPACSPYALYYLPSGSAGSLWCTNRINFSPSPAAPTFGILNQIAVGLGDVSSYQWPLASKLDPINFFRRQFDLGPLSGWASYPVSNIFTCPFTPVREIHLFTSWSANDPLVHYTLADLKAGQRDWDFSTNYSSVQNLGKTNPNYQPWNDSGYTATAAEPRVKDPWVRWPDDWDFPQNQKPDLAWVGRVHRGTPWQTVYWKSGAIPDSTWRKWLSQPWPDDPLALMPTNDWRLPELLAPYFTTNYPYSGESPNQASEAAYATLFDGMTVYANTTGELRAMTLLADSPEAGSISRSVQQARANTPGGYFRSVADLFAVPALSLASPFYDLSTWTPFTDAAYEAIPAQLAGRIRPDSIGTVVGSRIRFTGLSGYLYQIQGSTDIVKWTAVTNLAPLNGIVEIDLPPGGCQKFFRSHLLEP